MAKQIKISNIVQVPEVVIDPQFFVPEDVALVRPATTEELIPNDPDDDYLSGVDYDPALIDPTVNDPATGDQTSGTGDGSQTTVGDPPIDSVGVLQTPQTISVVSQSIRFTADGTAVVDVVISVEDIMGATNYEVRVTPQ